MRGLRCHLRCHLRLKTWPEGLKGFGEDAEDTECNRRDSAQGLDDKSPL